MDFLLVFILLAIVAALVYAHTQGLLLTTIQRIQDEIQKYVGGAAGTQPSQPAYPLNKQE